MNYCIKDKIIVFLEGYKGMGGNDLDKFMNLKSKVDEFYYFKIV